MCTCQIYRIISHTFLCRNSKPGTIQTQFLKSFILLVAWIPMMKMKMSLSPSLKSASRCTGTNSSPESTMISSEPLSEKSLKSEPSFSTNSTASRWVMHVHSAHRHFETYNFRQCDTRVTNAKTDKGTLSWTKGDYWKCPKLMQLV